MLASVLSLLLAAQPALSPAETAVLACSAKAEAERLGCYDRVAGQLSEAVLAGMEAPSAPARPMSAEEVSRQATAAAQGAPLRARSAPVAGAGAPTSAAAPTPPPMPSEEGPSERGPLEAQIARIDFDAYDDAIVTLADGQVWRQLRSDSRELRARDAEEAEAAIIKRGALGSYRMTVEPSGRTLRVRRER